MFMNVGYELYGQLAKDTVWWWVRYIENTYSINSWAAECAYI